MKRQLLLIVLVALVGSVSLFAQRNTDKLDRSLVAVQTNDGVFCSWRIFGEEYYDVTYNLYRDGQKVNEKPLTVSNYLDASGTSTSKYVVKAIVRGTEDVVGSKEVSVDANFFKEITPKHDASLKSTYIPNDICVADVDGDGEMEFLVKYDNKEENAAGYPKEGNNGEYTLLECIEQDGTVLWWINCGPNMGDFQNNEQNLAGYDWDKDGKSEVVLRLAEGSTIHKNDGTVFTVGGDNWKNHRIPSGGGQWFTYYGDEYLLYLEGATGNVYQCIDFPLKRYEEGETSLEKAWGDGYGHRQGKYFFGAPFFDGRNASIFLARGIYTRHKMIAYDVNPATHELTVRWQWNCNSAGPWYGQGYHNYCVGDVDMDGRDEIVFGSMVIDDNGKGLSTTGLGHGDAEHLGDFNPYVPGLEFFACNEDNPNNNYRNATTSEIYYRSVGSRDDGRSMCGNFSNDYYGALAYSSYDGGISCVANKNVGASGNGVATNFRIYWDGDLLEETFNYCNGKNTAGAIYKYGEGEIQRLTGSMTNNDTKGTPCAQADVYGDWREEVIMRTADNKIRIFTTTIPTKWRNYTLWHDHQYRNAMVWQMNGYNQPPHVSYFLGEKENITIAPPPLTMSGREEVANAGSVTTAHDDKHVIICEPNDMTVAIEEGAKPYILTINTPSWVQGTAPSNCTTKDVEILYSKYTHTVTGAALSGQTRFVKMGDGILNMPAVENTHSGQTDIWGGIVNFDGKMTNSPVWLNRHTTLNTAGSFNRKVSADYGAKIAIGGDNNVAVAVIDTLELNFGATLSVDLYGGETISSDKVVAKKVIFNKLNDETAPMTYLKPIVNMISHKATGEKNLTAGKYLICEFESMEGTVSDIILAGRNGIKASLIVEENKLYVLVEETRAAQTIYWIGDVNNKWDFALTENFVDKAGNKRYFVSGDTVVFNDAAQKFDVEITEPLMPGLVVFGNETSVYTLTGDSLIGNASINKDGAANVKINNINRIKGSVVISSGEITVGKLSYVDGDKYGAFGSRDVSITIGEEGKLTTSGTVFCSHGIYVKDGASLNVAGSLSLTASVSALNGTKTGWYKRGTGTLTLGNVLNTGALHIVEGTVNAGENGTTMSTPDYVYFEGGVLKDANNVYSYTTSDTKYVVEEGQKGTWYTDARCTYRGTLTGSGALTLYSNGPRLYLACNWSEFAGVISTKSGASDASVHILNSYGLGKATLNSDCYTSNSQDREGTYNVKIGALNGTATMAGAGMYTIGGNNKDCKFEGIFNGSKLTKVGTGALSLTTVQSSIATSDVYVNGGVLSLENAKYEENFFGLNTIRCSGEGTTLMGRTKVADVYIENGASLMPGCYTDSERYGNMMLSNVYIYEGSSLDLLLRNTRGKTTSLSNITVSRNIIIKGDVNVELGVSFTPKADVEFTLWTCSSFEKAASAKINLPELPEGFEWDTTDLWNATGILRIKASNTAVEHIAYDAIVSCEVYNLLGVKVAEFSAARYEAISKVRSEVNERGIFVVKMSADGITESVKIVK